MCRTDIKWGCKCVEKRYLKTCRKRDDLHCSVEMTYQLLGNTCRPCRTRFLTKQADILYQCLSKHDKDIYDDHDNIPAQHWKNGRWEWEWTHGEWRERRINHPDDLKYMHEARYADERAAKYQTFLDRNPRLDDHKFPRSSDPDWHLDRIAGPPLTPPYITVGDSGLRKEE